MSTNVFANGREVSSKSGSGKSICAFPDVCMTPPQTPATPPGVPIPYPNTGMDSDMSEGSKNVKISNKEVLLKDKSYFKKSTGDEAGSAPMKGVITHKNTGKVYFKSWSMDVKFEGENVVRHLDMTTHNHACEPGQTAPWPFAKAMTVGTGDPCEADKKNEEDACKDYKDDPAKACQDAGLGGGKLANVKSSDAVAAAAKKASADTCIKYRRCKLVPYKPDGCCPAQTGDHVIPKSSFFKKKFVPPSKAVPEDFMDGWEHYDYEKAPCMCLEGGSNSGSHGLRHAHHKLFSPVPNGTPRSFDDELKLCAKGVKAVAPHCNQPCIEAQLKEAHKGMGDQTKQIKHSNTGKNFKGRKVEFIKKLKEMLPKFNQPGR